MIAEIGIFWVSLMAVAGSCRQLQTLGLAMHAVTLAVMVQLG